MKKVLLLTLIAMLLFGIMACKPKVDKIRCLGFADLILKRIVID